MGKHVVSLETDSYTRQRAPPHPPRRAAPCPSFFCRIPSATVSLFSVGRRHFYFPLSFIMSGTLPADTLVLEKDAQEGVDARVFFPPLAPGSPQLSFEHSPFAAPLPVEKTKIQVGDIGDPLINIVSRYCTYVGLLISFHSYADTISRVLFY